MNTIPPIENQLDELLISFEKHQDQLPTRTIIFIRRKIQDIIDSFNKPRTTEEQLVNKGTRIASECEQYWLNTKRAARYGYIGEICNDIRSAIQFQHPPTAEIESCIQKLKTFLERFRSDLIIEKPGRSTTEEILATSRT